MTGLRHRHTPQKRATVALLLVLQALGGGAVTLAHASDRVTAPAAIEARHDARCIVLRDALRCALCHYAGIQITTQTARPQAPTGVVTERRPTTGAAAPARTSDHLSSPPRAPPFSRA